jgi:hypothetical protein
LHRVFNVVVDLLGPTAPTPTPGAVLAFQRRCPKHTCHPRYAVFFFVLLAERLIIVLPNPRQINVLTSTHSTTRLAAARRRSAVTVAYGNKPGNAVDDLRGRHFVQWEIHEIV